MRHIRNAYKEISLFFPEDQLMQGIGATSTTTTTQSNLWIILIHFLEPGVANGFMDVYKAYCNYYRSPAHNEFMHHVTDLVERGSIELDLTECPGMEPKSDITIDLVPVFAALRFNTHFRSVRIEHARKEVIQLVSRLLSVNTFITKVSISAGADEKSFLELSKVLQANQNHAVQVLQLTNNSIGNKGMIAMSEALQVWPHALRVLDLSNSHIHAKGMVSLIVSFENLFGMSLSIEELRLDGNSLDKEGANALESWFSHVKSYSGLKILSLANANLNVSLVPSLRSLSHLVELNLAGNKIDGGEGCRTLAFVCENSSSLRKLNLSETGLNRESLEPIVEAIIGNLKINGIKLYIAGNDLGPKGFAYMASVLPRVSLSVLDLSNMKMKEKHFTDLIEAATKAEKLEELIISKVMSKNSKTTASKSTVPIVVALSILPSENKSLKRLNLSDGFGRIHILPFLEGLQKNESLEALNISNNQLGDKGKPNECHSHNQERNTLPNCCDRTRHLLN